MMDFPYPRPQSFKNNPGKSCMKKHFDHEFGQY